MFSMKDKAHEIMTQNFTLGMQKEWKANNSPVTASDIAINTLLINESHTYFPDHDILAEEESDRSQHSNKLWVCDPIDGTIPFSNGMPNFVFSLARVVDGEPTHGLIHDSVMNRTLYAEKGSGAFLNGKPTHVTTEQDPNKCVFGIEYWKHALYNVGSLYQKINESGGMGLSVGSIVYSGLLIAAGEFGGLIFPSDHAHDPAAMKLIIEEAGGKTSDFFGNEQRYDGPTNGFVAAAPQFHPYLLEMIEQALKDSNEQS